jgi:hypothetical protein
MASKNPRQSSLKSSKTFMPTQATPAGNRPATQGKSGGLGKATTKKVK